MNEVKLSLKLKLGKVCLKTEPRKRIVHLVSPSSLAVIFIIIIIIIAQGTSFWQASGRVFCGERPIFGHKSILGRADSDLN